MLTKSKQPRKQRKARYNAPMHKRQKLLNAHISKELRKKLKTAKRSITLRKGDKVKVLRGEHKKKEGKVTAVDLNNLKVYVEGIVDRRASGAEVQIALDPSNVMIIDGEFGNKDRETILGRSAKK
ncbi:MAG: 50S ribosomal protein L24 [Candidatus Micrarchaeota archaeon]